MLSIWEGIDRGDDEKGMVRVLINIAAFWAVGIIQFEGLSSPYQGSCDPCR